MLRFIPNTSVLVTWGQKPTTGQLSDFINGRTEGNILNSKALHSANELVSYYSITCVDSFEYYILSTFLRHKASPLQDTVIILFGVAMLLALRRPLLH